MKDHYLICVSIKLNTEPTGKGIVLSITRFNWSNVRVGKKFMSISGNAPFNRIKLSLHEYRTTTITKGGTIYIFSWSKKIPWQKKEVDSLIDDCLFEMSLHHVDDNIKGIVSNFILVSDMSK